MKQALPVTWMLAALLLADVASAQQPIFYPAKGQSQQKQANDMSQCESWATQNTGVNPAVLAQNSANQPPPPQQSGQRLRGAAGGAATGAAIGAIAGDAGKGAAAGAIAGTVVGGSRQRRQAAAAQEQQQAAQQQTSQQMATWNRALAACMNGRGYTVQ
ncbi:glycine zipper family protein [Paraburkholderia sp. CNPSo 3157]|uniref:Glycine zipper family protein n=1 Tax=Paraburkholderia franconis TaxID=2654983 RepID=A0A7X1NBS1_9BURK|nr:glycine zipper family protein [Paraburkholderia franconis]